MMTSAASPAPLGVVTLVSLEPWDATWRRNQYLAHHLVADGHVTSLRFVAPAPPLRHVAATVPEPGIRVLTPHLVVPRRLLGGRETGVEVAVRASRGADVLWVNDPVLGAGARWPGVPVVYDVTDDWRSYPDTPQRHARLVRAEDRLARSATTVVCSRVLAQRWRDRYGVTAELIGNGVDLAAYAVPFERVDLPGEGPHLGYVGTLQPERLDIDLLLALATQLSAGTVHLVGPDALGQARARLEAHPRIRIHPPLVHAEVPRWLRSFDLLACPHLINDFTLSLDAIKAYEYAAAGRPVVATPTSGFQDATTAGVVLAEAPGFVVAVERALASPGVASTPDPASGWAARAETFAAVLRRAAAGA